MDMLQDDKGFMWFSTWDGLSRFDGYKFRIFKVRPGDKHRMNSNRIDDIQNDKYGRIWFISYDGEAHCFDQRTEMFWGIQSIPGYENYPFIPTSIQIMPSGKVWLLSEQNGAICVNDSSYNVKFYNQDLKNLSGKSVNTIFEDASGNSWLLTENGINIIQKFKNSSLSYFFENRSEKNQSKQAFYSSIEIDGEIFLGSDKGRIWRYLKKNGSFSLLQLEAKSKIIGFRKISGKDVLITTATDGFFNFDLKSEKQSALLTKGPFNPKSGDITETYMDKKGRLWIVTVNLGIFCLDMKSGNTSYFYIKTEDESTNIFPPKPYIIEDVNGRLWVQPRGGGFSLYNEVTNMLEPFHNNFASTDWKFSNIIHSGFSDKQGNLWLCTRSNGLEKVIFDRDFFKTMAIQPDNKSLGNDVRAVFQDKDNRLWIATKDKRLTLYDINKKRIGNISMDGSIQQNSFMPGVVYCIMQDKENNIWLGIKGEGLIKLSKVNGAKNWQVSRFRTKEDDLYSLSDDRIYSIYQDKKGHIWIGTYGGGLNLLAISPEGKRSECSAYRYAETNG